MGLQRRRRIFRSSMPWKRRNTGVKILALAGVIAGAAMRAAVLPQGQAYAPPAPEKERVISAPAEAVAVVDGETLRLGTRVVRLMGVHAPFRSENDSCAQENCAAREAGSAATKQLAELVRGRSVRCEVAGEDAMRRSLAICRADDTDLNRALASRLSFLQSRTADR
ncbi:MAG: hypothetical protein IRZ23_09645 [Acetobacteraceae bacterium]|nr:hypothetical protein [Acetobacteraceae bacterium]